MTSLPELNIAHVVFSFDYGGLERRILRLIEALAPLGCRFSVVSLRPSQGNFLDPKLPVDHFVLGSKPGADFAAIGRLAQYFRDNNIHIVHSHNWVSMLEGVLAAKLARVPVTVHGEHGAKRFEPQQLVWRRTLSQMLLCRLANQIIPVNDAINLRLQELWRLSGNRLTTIRNGVDTDKFAPHSRVVDDLIRVGSLSRLDPVKNFPCLIRAIALLNSNEPQRRYHLTIVGDGDQRADLTRLVDSLNANDFIELAGPTDTAQDWYRNFDIYVNSSFSEGMSNTVLEAMACGLPIVATDVAGHRDWLIENKHALFFESDNAPDLAEKIALFGNNPQMRRTVAANNRAHVEQGFSQKRFIEEYQTLYQQLLSAQGYCF